MYTEWAIATTALKDRSPQLHAVEFPRGPRNVRLITACGLHGFFVARTGIRIDDRFCGICERHRIKEDQE